MKMIQRSIPASRAALIMIGIALVAAFDRLEAADKPNILIIWGDDVGVTNIDRLSDLEGLVEERGLRTVLERARAVLYAKRRLDLPARPPPPTPPATHPHPSRQHLRAATTRRRVLDKRRPLRPPPEGRRHLPLPHAPGKPRPGRLAA